MTIGEKITQRRLAAHLSQEILAERLGVSTQDVSRWESGEVLPDAEKLLQLCRVFGISADELLGENAKADDASDFLSLPLWRWSLRVISPPLAFAGTAAALTGLTGAVYHALTADQWYTDFGRFGTALRSTWCGPGNNTDGAAAPSVFCIRKENRSWQPPASPRAWSASVWVWRIPRISSTISRRFWIRCN